MQRYWAALVARQTRTRGFCSLTTPAGSGNGGGGGDEKIVASALFARLPVVILKIDPVVYAFPEFVRFNNKSQVIATNKFKIRRCDDFVWVTKDELLEYFLEPAEFLSKMIIS